MMPNPGPSTHVKIEFAQASDPGRDPNKQVNEDSCGYAETKLGHLAVLCDGMGGHYGGQEASRTAIQTIFEIIEQTPPGIPAAAALKAAIEEAGRRVYRLGGAPDNRGRPGSTVVAMLLHDRGVDVAHVGDSRAYVIRAGQIYPLTRDHSMVQGLIDAGMLTEQQAIGHPDANKITRALGMKPEVEVELRPEPMELYPGDVLIMTSDGLTDLVLNADILGCARQALASGPVEHACRMLVQMANDRGGHDNITVQMARILETGSRSLTIPASPPDSPATAPAPTHAGTVMMTRSDAQAPGATAPQQPSPTAPWGPIPPTAPDNGGPGPTAPDPAHTPLTPTATQVDHSAPAGQAQPRMTEPGSPSPAAFRPPSPAAPGAAAADLAAYQIEGNPGTLPLPPPATPSYVAGAFGGPPQTQPGGLGVYGHAPAQGFPGAPFGSQNPGAAISPSLAGPTSPSGADAKPSRGGIVFVIIGASAVIAVLLLLLVWALLLR